MPNWSSYRIFFLYSPLLGVWHCSFHKWATNNEGRWKIRAPRKVLGLVQFGVREKDHLLEWGMWAVCRGEQWTSGRVGTFSCILKSLPTTPTPAANICKSLLKNCRLFCKRDSLTRCWSWLGKGEGVGGLDKYALWKFTEGPICNRLCSDEAVYLRKLVQSPGPFLDGQLWAPLPPFSTKRNCCCLLTSRWRCTRSSHCYNMHFLKTTI